MNNQEKAKEIADRIVKASNERAELNDYHDVKQSAIEMAEWKDNRFKEYLEKKKAELPSRKYLSDFELGVIEGKEFTLDEIINEFFGEDMI